MILNVSRLQEFMDCPQKFNFKYEPQGDEFPLGLVVAGGEEGFDNLNFGTAIHAGLAAGYDSADTERSVAAFKTHPLTPEDLSEYGERMLRAYWAEYPNDFSSWRVVGTEVPLSMAVGLHTLVGRLDLIVETKGGGALDGLWHVQHKTVGKTVGLSNYSKKFVLSNHERAYAALGRANGIPIKGSIINLLRKTDFADHVHDFIELKERGRVVVRCSVCSILRSAIRDSDNPPFLRERVVMTDFLVERCLEDIQAAASFIEGNAARWQNPNHCYAYNKECSFIALCKLGMDPGSMEFSPREADYVDEQRRASAGDVRVVQRGDQTTPVNGGCVVPVAS